ncbi:hypothetical protein GDO81_024197 [Engystomops pustulosus]|uniref:Uncharacterized protein n=1 Tax=Engystomops pustulosus TaxID=76066 RepID=A0AAV6YK99_ENGPU|nr:hypothetical protein GDO81_024197 [Engystomops pustulosus]
MQRRPPTHRGAEGIGRQVRGKAGREATALLPSFQPCGTGAPLLSLRRTGSATLSTPAPGRGLGEGSRGSSVRIAWLRGSGLRLGPTTAGPSRFGPGCGASTCLSHEGSVTGKKPLPTSACRLTLAPTRGPTERVERGRDFQGRPTRDAIPQCRLSALPRTYSVV